MTQLAEATRSLRASLITTSLSIAIAALAVSTILLSTAETLQAEQTILSSLDDPTLRLVVFRDPDGSAELSERSAERIAALSSVEWAFALGPAHDLAAFEGGPAIPVRAVFGVLPDVVALPPAVDRGQAAVGRDALGVVGMTDGVGVLVGDQTHVATGGSFEAASPIEFLQSQALRSPLPQERPTQLVLLAQDVLEIDSTVRSAIEVSGAAQPGRIAVTLPEDLGAVREAVSGEIGRSGRALTIVVLAGASALTALLATVGVVTRRPDLGRRRALGATRRRILQLVVVQTAATSSVGATIGAVAALAYRSLEDLPAPPLDFAAAAVVLVTAASTTAGLLPAATAAASNPVRVLRVP